MVPNKMTTLVKPLLLSLFLSFSLIVSAQDCPPKSTGQLVNDFANVLSSSEEQRLTQKLEQFSNQTSNQIVIVTHPDFCGDAPYNFATEIGENWGVGQEKFDNGVVIVFKPKTRSSRGQAFIAVGYGLEGAIPDATSKQIVDREMIPEFKNQNTFKGLDAGVNTLMSIAKGEIDAEGYGKKSARNDGSPIFAIVIFLLIIGMVFFGRARRARKYADTNDLSFWAAFWMMSSMGGGHSGYYNNFHSGSGGFGGGGGGGFGGFGGGGFGGGGAGGSW